MQKISRSNLKFIRRLRSLQDHGGLKLEEAVKVSVSGSCNVYIMVDLGPHFLPLAKDIGTVDQLPMVLWRLGL